jgi:hypothetical protein
MEFRESDGQSISLEGPFFSLMHPTHRQEQHSPHQHGPIRQWALLHEVMIPVITVCITLIFEAPEHVVLNPSSFHNIFLELCSLPCLNLGG